MSKPAPDAPVFIDPSQYAAIEAHCRLRPMSSERLGRVLGLKITRIQSGSEQVSSQRLRGIERSLDALIEARKLRLIRSVRFDEVIYAFDPTVQVRGGIASPDEVESLRRSNEELLNKLAEAEERAGKAERRAIRLQWQCKELKEQLEQLEQHAAPRAELNLQGTTAERMLEAARQRIANGLPLNWSQITRAAGVSASAISPSGCHAETRAEIEAMYGYCVIPRGKAVIRATSANVARRKREKRQQILEEARKLRDRGVPLCWATIARAAEVSYGSLSPSGNYADLRPRIEAIWAKREAVA